MARLCGCHLRIRVCGLAALLGAAALLAPATGSAASEVVSGVIRCTPEAPRSATMSGTSGIIENELVCSSRPAEGDCTERIRQNLESRGCAFRRDLVDDVETLYFVCSGGRGAMVDIIDLVCRRLNGF